MSIAKALTRSLPAGLRSVLDELLPQTCLLCVAPSGNAALCAGCAATLPLLTRERCPVCALPTPGAETCGTCLKRPPHFDATSAIYRYTHPVDHLVHLLKYSHRLASADFLGKALCAPPTPARPDLLVPVPLSEARLEERGFNQAVELARPLALALGLRLELDGIHRARDTTAQAALPWKERAKNIRHAFECRLDLTGKTVLVIDDVMTTGATLNELAGTLKAAGAARVDNAVVARTLKD